MNRDQFWALVDEIGWGTRTTDCDAVEKMLLKRFTPAEAEEARDHFEECWGALYTILSPLFSFSGALDADGVYIRSHISDDSFSDLCYHIVGLGREEWQRNIDNPKLAETRAKDRDYVESFGACFPWEDTYEYLNLAVYVGRAEELATYTYTEAQDKGFCAPEMQLVVASMTLLCDEKVTEFMATREQTEAAVEKIAAEGRSRVEQLLGYMVGVDGGTVFNPWMVKNLYSDMDRYIVNF